VEEEWASFLPKLKAKGYEAVDAALWDEAKDALLAELLQKNGLGLAAMVPTGGETVAEHLKNYEAIYRRAKKMGAFRIYSHAGHDSFSERQQDEFFSGALASDPSVCFETHRGRILYSPWVAGRLMEKFPKLRLNADYSHWTVVTESLLESKACRGILAEAARRTDHLHARVGYAEGPQVPDPRSPLWGDALEAHERFWDAIWESQKSRGLELSGLTPEFGPPPYQPLNPRTGKPDADLAEICDWMASRQSARFQSKFL
jgi:hypothetical protein